MNSNDPSPVDRQQGTTKAETRKANKAIAAGKSLNDEIETAYWSISYSRISPCLPVHFFNKLDTYTGERRSESSNNEKTKN